MNNNFLIFYLEKVNSTNTEIKNYNKKNYNKKNIALLAYEQTDGKGRLKNRWISGLGDLTCSFLFNKKIKVNKLGQINIVISVSIVEALKEIFPDIEVKVKWPNDLYIENKKLGGILLESQISSDFVDYFIVGLGVNIVSCPNIQLYGTTKITEFTKRIDLKKIFYKVGYNLDKNICNWEKNGFEIFKKKWLIFSKDIGNNILIKKNNNLFNGIFININENGELLMKTREKKTISFSFGEIF